MSITKYYTPTLVYFGAGAEKKAGQLLKANGATRVLIHFGTGSVKRSGLLDRVEADLAASGIEYVEFGGAVANPRLSLVRKGVELVKNEKLDYILAVGGGSVLDSAKAIGYGAYNGGDVWDFYCRKRNIEGTVPVGVILTLSATGTEMSASSVITNDESEITYKRGVSSDFGRVKFALLNPELTYTVSAYQTASGSTDIMMHTLERYFHDGNTLSLTDRLTFELLRQVIESTQVAIAHPDDWEMLEQAAFERFGPRFRM